MMWSAATRFAATRAVMVGLTLASVWAAPCALPAALAGDPVTLDKPIPAEVYVKTEAKAAKQLKGVLVRYDDEAFTIKVGKEEQTLGWADVTPASAVALRTKAIDRTKAAHWLGLGELAWNLGVKDQAQQALKQAVKLDAKLQPEADRISASTPTPPSRPKPAEPATEKPPQAGGGFDTSEAPPPVNPGRKGGEKPSEQIKYTPATPEQAAAANTRARAQAGEVTKQLGIKFEEFETDHFLVFTDWDKREFDFLKKNLERAYTVVSKQFDMSPKDNIFVGKLPVYMFAKYDDFSKFARHVDEHNVTNRTAGYYTGDTRGFGHMAMWKPNATLTQSNDIKEAEKLWGYVLVHEFTHAFLARYRSNTFIPRWLNEGCAEVIANDVIPMSGRYEQARLMALQGANVTQLFDDENIPGGEYYPVMHTMVELLVKTNRKNFVKMIDAIKDGEDPADALKKYYNTDYDTLAKEWRDYAKRLARN